MKRYLPTVLLLTLIAVFAACNQEDTTESPVQLTVVSGSVDKTYTLDDLRALPTSSVEIDGAVYSGVTLVDLLEDAGIEAGSLASVEAVASDGFSAAYEPELIMLPTTIVAYSLDDGDLLADEQPLRMVLLDQPGRLNVRMLDRLEASP